MCYYGWYIVTCFIVSICLVECPELIKHFYIEHPDVAMLSPDEAERIRKDNGILEVKDLSEGENKRPIPNPSYKFEHAYEHYRMYS